MEQGMRAAGLIVLFSLCGTSSAELIDRGGGMIYDTVLNVTWLQDANYAHTSGYAPGGRMTWREAMDWAENLSYGGYSDWRLPRVRPRNGISFDYGTNSSEPSGQTDLGFNIAGPYSELGYMFYLNLGNTGYYTTAGDVNPEWYLVNSGPFSGLVNGHYWTSTPYQYSPDNLPWNPTYCAPPVQCAWDFVIGYGDQTIYSTNHTFYAWAVRDGDVLPEDRDNDGVDDAGDLCLSTTIPESAPTSGTLGKARWALRSGTSFSSGSATSTTYTTSDTAGCSCEQIVAALGLGVGQLKYGCSRSVMDAWIIGIP